MAGFKDIFTIDNAAPAEQTHTKSVAAESSGVYAIKETDVINLKNINLAFDTKAGEKFVLFDNFNLDIPDFTSEKQFISIMGQSGCGKSTILNIISGLMKPDSGSVQIYGKEIGVNDSVPMIFQNYSSYPWLTVLDNVALPLKLKGIGKEERYEKSMELLKVVGLNGQEQKWTNKLSGGQYGKRFRCVLHDDTFYDRRFHILRKKP
jgi:NitT/TauT family transport system ATP-binding protein